MIRRKKLPEILYVGVRLNNMSSETGLGVESCKMLKHRGYDDVSLRIYCESYVYLVINKMRKVKMCYSRLGGFRVPLMFLYESCYLGGSLNGSSALKVKISTGEVVRYRLHGASRVNYDSDFNMMSAEILRMGLYFREWDIKRGSILLKSEEEEDDANNYLWGRYGYKRGDKVSKLLLANKVLIEQGKKFDWMVWGEEREVLRCGDNGIYAVRFKHGCVFFKNWENPYFYAFQDYHGNLWRNPEDDEQQLIEAMLRAITAENELSKVFVC